MCNNVPIICCVIFIGLFLQKLSWKIRLINICICVCIYNYSMLKWWPCTSTYRFHLTTAALDELLKLIHRLSPQPNLCVKSAYTFKKFLSELCPHADSSRHPYCSMCLMPIENDMYCHGENNVEYFIITDFVGQLRSKFKGTALYKIMLSSCLWCAL